MGSRRDGFRVVAVAIKTLEAPKTAYSVADECDLTLGELTLADVLAA